MTTFKLSKNLELPARAVTEKIAFMGRTGSGKSFAAQRLAEEMLTAGVQVVVLDPGGDWWGLRALSDGSPSGFHLPVFGGLHGDLPLEAESGALVSELIVERSLSAVLDVSMMRDAGLRRFAKDFAEELFARVKRTRRPLHLFLEECQTFVPQHVDNAKAPMVGAFEDLVKIGRKFGIGASLISQRPQAVNKNVLNQTELLLCFQLTGTQERKAIEAWVADKGADEKLSAELQNLEIGEAVAWSPSWLKVYKRLRVERKRTLDAGATPTLEMGVSHNYQIAPLDIEELRDAMVGVVERAEENDPSKLRARIKELEARRTADTDALMVAAAIARAEKAERILEEVEEQNVALIARIDEIRSLATGFEIIPSRAKEKTSTTDAQAIAESIVEEMNNRTDFVAEAPVTINQQASSVHFRYVGPKDHRGNKPEKVLGLKRGAVRMLQVLACWQPTRLTKTQLATLSEMTESGTFSEYLGALRRNGFIDENRAGVTATNNGVQALNGNIPPRPSSTAELVAAWSRQLKAGARRMLDVLIQAYPKGRTRESLAKSTGMTNSGTFSEYLSKLRRNGLAEIDEDGNVRASRTLFLVEDNTVHEKRNGASSFRAGAWR